MHFRMIDVQAAGNSDFTHRDHKFRPRHGVVGPSSANRIFSDTGPVINSPSA